MKSDTSQTVMVPVDFSPSSEAAIQFAARMVSRSGGVIALLYVIDPFTMIMPPDVYSPGFIYRRAYQDNYELLAELANRVEKRHGVATTWSTYAGTEPEAIHRAALLSDANLIVLRKKTASGLPGLFGRSIAYHLSRLSSIPVVSLDSERTDSSVQKIVVPFNSDRRTLLKASEITSMARAFHASIKLFAFTDDKSSPLNEGLVRDGEELMRYFSLYSIDSTLALEHGRSYPDAALSYARNNDADLICVTSGRRAKWSLFPKTEKTFIQSSRIPVLSVSCRSQTMNWSHQ